MRFIKSYSKLLFLFILGFVSILRLESQESGKFRKDILHAVVNINDGASGLLIKHQVSNSFKYYLVTNKHVIGDWHPSAGFVPNDSIIVYVYYKDESKPILNLEISICDKLKNLLPHVKIHPNKDVDIVIIDITPVKLEIPELDLKFIDSSLLLPIDSIVNKSYVDIGEQVYAIGYPLGITSKNSRKPIVKSGIVASELNSDLVLNVNLKNLNGDKTPYNLSGKIFLVDGLIVRGNSGGPIVSATESRYLVTKEGRVSSEGNIPNMILGIVSIGYNNSGISIIFSCDYIIELLND